jgi:glycosyltransferase involved in cell wall biosynthesis
MDDRESLPNPVCCGATEAERPLVSVIVTFFNQASFVRETIESVLSQNYSPYEVIVVDDGSTDDTPHVCASFGDQIIFDRQSNAGVSAARDAGVRRARGSLLAFLDGDDLWEPGKIAAQVDAAQRYRDSGLIISDGVVFQGSEILASTLYWGPVARHFASSGEATYSTHCHDTLLRTILIKTPSQVMIPTHVMSRVGPWDHRFRLSGCYELWLRIAAFGYSFTFLAQPLVRYRYVPTSLSGPANHRGFIWGLQEYKVFRAHRRYVGPHIRRTITSRLHELTSTLARDAYYEVERRQNPAWGRRYLLGLALRSRRPHLVAPYLAALCLPSRLVGVLKRIARSPRRGDRNEE